MTVYDRIRPHDLVGIDQHGHLCSCGAQQPSWLEHLAAIALDALDAPAAFRRANTTRRTSPLEREAELTTRQRLIHPQHYDTRALLQQLANELADDERHLTAAGITDPEERRTIKLQIRLDRIHRIEEAFAA